MPGVWMCALSKEQQLLERCLAAFGEAAVYFGGPHDLNNAGRARASASALLDHSDDVVTT